MWATALLLCTMPLTGSAQEDADYRMEIGGGVGASFYLGDLNNTMFSCQKPAAGIYWRYLFDHYNSLKVNLTYAGIKGSTEDQDNFYPYDPKTQEAVLIAAADALSAARPGARRETLDVYIKRLEKLEEIANTTPGVDKSYAIQAGREIRIIAKPEEVKDDEIALLARDISKRIESELEYPGQIKVNVVRETRAVDYAK